MASVGGFVRQYQITVDPNRLRAYDISLSRIRDAVRRSNIDVGGRVFETAETEFMVRGEGYIRGLDDVRSIALGVDASGTPVTVQDVATVQFGPEIRRGVAELNGEGEVVGGIVVVRSGENVHEVVTRVKARLDELRPGLPEGVEVVPVYDRTVLIENSVAILRQKLLEEMAIVALVCAVFLLHVRSALVAVITLPLAVLMAFIVMYVQGVGANIMSLGGIAIAIGAMVDAAIVIVENAHRHLERDRGRVPHWRIIARASTEVGPTLFFALLVITLSFAPIFALEAQEGRLFRPLAYTKTYAMAAAALLSVTLVPVLAGYWMRGRIRPARRNPITWLLMALYRPVLRRILAWRWVVLALTLAGAAATVVPVSRLGSEFMPPLWEGDLLYMPTTPARGVHHQGPRDPAADGPDPSRLPRSGPGLRQGRAGGNRHRPGAAEHDRDDDPVETGKRMAARHDTGPADCRDGRCHPLSGADERLDDAHQDPDRHAFPRVSRPPWGSSSPVRI